MGVWAVLIYLFWNPTPERRLRSHRPRLGAPRKNQDKPLSFRASPAAGRAEWFGIWANPRSTKALRARINKWASPRIKG